DPPPDLGLEIDISRTSRYRMRVYADLRVPEVWQYDGETVRVYQLDVNGQYLITDRSRYFPAIPIAELAAFLSRRAEMDEVSLFRVFRDWVREQRAAAKRQSTCACHKSPIRH